MSEAPIIVRGIASSAIRAGSAVLFALVSLGGAINGLGIVGIALGVALLAMAARFLIAKLEISESGLFYRGVFRNVRVPSDAICELSVTEAHPTFPWFEFSLVTAERSMKLSAVRTWGDEGRDRLEHARLLLDRQRRDSCSSDEE